jgi:pimeloyl-ACP methyl ester carboxylesterase
MPFENRSLLNPPVARAAYSDRTAWLMAEMSRLAYERFESPAEILDGFVEHLASLEEPRRIKSAIERFLQELPGRPGEGREKLETALAAAGFELVGTFDNGGTQAYLARRVDDRIAVLAFRGTEKDFRDIKTDLNARFYRNGGTRTHSGFLNAFRRVEPAIRQALEELSDYKVYITGHSLGGALALIASRRFSADNIAACYTFGSPKVGDEEFGDAIKVPIYRVVNAADSVPSLPPTWLWEILIGLAWFVPVPYVRRAALALAHQFRGYRHHGDMRYLTDCRDDRSDVRLVANPSGVERSLRIVKRLIADIRAGVRDHSISDYCEKLEAFAVKRLDGNELDWARRPGSAGEPERAAHREMRRAQLPARAHDGKRPS